MYPCHKHSVVPDLTIRKAAEEVACSLAHIYRLIDEGQFEAYAADPLMRRITHAPLDGFKTRNRFPMSEAAR